MNRKVNVKARQVGRYSRYAQNRAVMALDRPNITIPVAEVLEEQVCRVRAPGDLSTRACVLDRKARERRAPASLVTVDHEH